jgi:hypothetical protein
MGNVVASGVLLAILSGLMNGSFTFPMRFLGRWQWENVWILFIVSSCLLLPATSQYSKVPYLRSPNENQFGITTWDGKERPAAKMLKDFSKITHALDLEGIEPAFAQAAILVPDEWSKRYGDESHFGLTGPENAPYTSTEDGVAVPGQPLPNRAEDNLRLQGIWLSRYVLAPRADVTFRGSVGAGGNRQVCVPV